MSILSLLALIVTAALPGLVWLAFFRAEDCHPEPKRTIVYAFSAGALVSIPVLALQLVFQQTLNSYLSGSVLLVVGLALIEEVFKFVAAYIAVNGDPAFDEPIDAMIYMVAAALGFATIENLFIIGRQFDVSILSSFTQTLQTLSLRFIGATLLHTLSSAVVGYYWARGKLVVKGVRDLIHTSFLECLTIGILAATAVHAVFNYFVLRFENENLLYPSLLLIGCSFFVFEDFERLRDRRVVPSTDQ